jgi:hypothetical protein
VHDVLTARGRLSARKAAVKSGIVNELWSLILRSVLMQTALQFRLRFLGASAGAGSTISDCSPFWDASREKVVQEFPADSWSVST